MQLLHKRKQSTWNCYIWKSAMAKVLLGTLVATSGNNDIHVNIFQVILHMFTCFHWSPNVIYVWYKYMTVVESCVLYFVEYLFTGWNMYIS